MRRAAKIDANQDEIVNALRGRGCDVISLAGAGRGVPDLLVLHCGDVFLVECKMPRGKLTDAQERLFTRWPVRIVRTLEDVGRFFPKIDDPN